jgi:hypothetical protein
MKTTRHLISTSDAAWIRANSEQTVPINLFEKEADGHKFKVGDEATLVGLVDFPEFNGQRVSITGIREDGPRGRAYYVQGEITKFCNWVYEYRLTA